MSDSVNHPAHYGGADNPYEAIKVIEAWELNFNLGNTVKYISRAGKKGDHLEDLQKARWYLDRAIGNLEVTLQERPRDGDGKRIVEYGHQREAAAQVQEMPRDATTPLVPSKSF